MTMTRRNFLSASAALAAAPVLGRPAGGAPLPREADIVVIGAAQPASLQRGELPLPAAR
jgi:hypothetical protein